MSLMKEANFKDNVTSIDALSKLTINLDGYVTEDNNLLKDLYIYYTTGLNEKYGGQVTFNYDTYCSTILKVGSETSNIASFDQETYAITLIDSNKYTITIFIKRNWLGCIFKYKYKINCNSRRSN